MAGNLIHHVRACHSGCVDGRLICSVTQKLVHLSDAPHAAAYRQRDKDFFGRPTHDVEGGLAVAGGRCDIKERQLVGTAVVVAVCELHRVSGISKAFKVNALDHAAGINVQAWDDAYGYSHDFS